MSNKGVNESSGVKIVLADCSFFFKSARLQLYYPLVAVASGLSLKHDVTDDTN